MFLSYISFIYFACTRVNMCHCVHVEVRGQLVCGVALFLSGSWGIECWWSGLMASTLTSWVISPALLVLIACVPVWCACVSAVIHVLWCGCRGQRMTTLNFPGRISLSFWDMTYSKLTGSRASGRFSCFYLPFPQVFQVCAAASGFLCEYQEFHSGSQTCKCFYLLSHLISLSVEVCET